MTARPTTTRTSLNHGLTTSGGRLVRKSATACPGVAPYAIMNRPMTRPVPAARVIEPPIHISKELGFTGSCRPDLVCPTVRLTCGAARSLRPCRIALRCRGLGVNRTLDHPPMMTRTRMPPSIAPQAIRCGLNVNDARAGPSGAAGGYTVRRGSRGPHRMLMPARALE